MEVPHISTNEEVRIATRQSEKAIFRTVGEPGQSSTTAQAWDFFDDEKALQVTKQIDYSLRRKKSVICPFSLSLAPYTLLPTG